MGQATTPQLLDPRASPPAAWELAVLSPLSCPTSATQHSMVCQVEMVHHYTGSSASSQQYMPAPAAATGSNSGGGSGGRPNMTTPGPTHSTPLISAAYLASLQLPHPPLGSAAAYSQLRRASPQLGFEETAGRAWAQQGKHAQFFPLFNPCTLHSAQQQPAQAQARQPRAALHSARTPTTHTHTPSMPLLQPPASTPQPMRSGNTRQQAQNAAL